jgi:hypothetical protein
MDKTTDCGHPERVFFNAKFLGLGRQIGQINFGAFGVFLAELKISKFQNEFMKSLFLPCTLQGRNLDIFSFIFLEKRWLHKFILKFTDLYQHPFWYCESLVYVFHYSSIFFYKNLSLYIHIPNVYLGFEFEFGQQRIRDLAFVCP